MVLSTRTINCEKWEGAGNDFLLIDEMVSPAEVRSLCDRHCGPGADGVIVRLPSAHALCRMVFFNADGKEADMCGNGLRVLFASGGWREGNIQVGNHFYPCHTGKRGYITALGAPSFIYSGETYHTVNTGVVHAVFYIPPENPKSFREKLQANITWTLERPLRSYTYERGVEGVTRACGTGIAAAHYVLHQKGSVDEEVEILSAGGSLFVSQLVKEGGAVNNILLEGPARQVFSGKVFLECDTIGDRENRLGQ